MLKKNKKKQTSFYDRLFKGRIGKYLTILFVSVWMFVLGLLVGRGTAPVKFEMNKLSKELAELKAADIQEQMARVKIKPDDSGTKTEMEFYEELKKTKKTVKRDKKQPTGSKKKVEKATAASKNKKTSKPPSVAKPKAPKKAEQKTQSKKPPASKPSQPAKKDASEKKLTIQAASLKDMTEAEELVKKLKKKGYPAYKTIGVVPEKGIWFRVRVGQYADREKAAETLKRLKKDGFDPYLVVR